MTAAPLERPGPAQALTQCAALTWRGIVKIRRNPMGLADVVVGPAVFLVLFGYVFGGAISGDTAGYLQYVFPGILVLMTLFAKDPERAARRLVHVPMGRFGTADEIVPNAWAAGDDAAIPDLAIGGNTLTVPNAQHAVRQAKLLAANIVATLRGKEPKPYVHHHLGVVATLGRGHGLFQLRRLVITGWPAWAMHRGYHLLAVPSWERKLRVLLGWVAALVGRRDVASLAAATVPRPGFESSAHGGPSPLRGVPIDASERDAA